MAQTIQNLPVHRLTTADFSEFFGIQQQEIPPNISDKIEQFNLEYRFLAPDRRDSVLLQVLQRLDSANLPISGEHRRKDWEKGWKENLDSFIENEYKEEELIPRCIHPHPLVRLRQEYVEACHSHFEWRFFQIIRMWMFQRFLGDADSLYEFGCGPGYNFLVLGEMFPEKNLYGLDWAESAVDLINLLAQTHKLRIKGRLFDFFAPDPTFILQPNSGIFTICALEQVGSRFEPFLQYLLHQSPRICLHMEPIVDWYDPDNLVDYLAIRYHEKRGYLTGFYPRLLQLQAEGRVQILHRHRARFGSLFHEGYSIIVWCPL